MFDGRTRSRDYEGHCSYLAGSRIGRGSHDVSYEFTKLSQGIEDNIHKIKDNVAQMNNMIEQVDVNKECSEVRDRLHKLQHYTNQLAKETSNSLRGLTDFPASASKSDQRNCKLLRERLMSDFATALNNFQLAQRKQKEMEHGAVSKVRTHLPDPFIDDVNIDGQLVILDSPTEQMEAQVECDDHTELLREYEQAINQLESDIMDVNEIFKDLGRMVHEQSELIDSIEANVETSATDIAYATNYLQQARRHQSKSRRKMCTIVFVIVFIVLLLVLVVSLAIRQQ